MPYPIADQKIQPDISRTVQKWQRKRGSLIMALHEIQNRFGYVPRDISLQIAQLMDVPLARIYEVLTFYNYFKIEPPGKHIVSVCLGTACYLKGADHLMDAFKQELKVGEGETTKDGLFHLQGVRCVGCCGLAPVVVVDGNTHSKVKAETVPNLLSTCAKEG
jgi:NADH:ubiquinone oxidoreductase subunit E